MRQLTERIARLAKQHKAQLKLFVFFGLIAFLADFGALRLCLALGAPLLLATAAGVTIGFIVSYTANHYRIGTVAKTKRKKESLPLFTILFLWNIFFTYAFIKVFKSHFTMPLLVPKALSVGFIMGWNYVLFHFIFTDKAHEHIDEII